MLENQSVPAAVIVNPRPLGARFEFDANDWLADELQLDDDPLVVKAHLNLLCRAWRNSPDAALPNHDPTLASWSGAGERWADIKNRVLAKWSQGAGALLHNRYLSEEAHRLAALEEKKRRRRELARLRKERQRQRENDAAIAPPDDRSRHAPVTRDIGVTQRDIVQNQELSQRDIDVTGQNSTVENPPDSPPLTIPHIESLCLEREDVNISYGDFSENRSTKEDDDGTLFTQSVSGKQSSRNQSPSERLEPAAARLKSAAHKSQGQDTLVVKKEKSKKATRIDPSWQPDESVLAVGERLDLVGEELENEIAKFRDHFASAPDARGRKLDWQATARNWLREAARRRDSSRTSGLDRNGRFDPYRAHPNSIIAAGARALARLKREQNEMEMASSGEYDDPVARRFK